MDRGLWRCGRNQFLKTGFFLVDVVGGKYLLKPEGGLPASTYKHDEELFVRPARRHPIIDSKGIRSSGLQTGCNRNSANEIHEIAVGFMFFGAMKIRR
jgi:hypothetical protein